MPGNVFVSFEEFVFFWYNNAHLQSRNRDTDVQTKRMITKGKGGWDEVGAWD